MQNKIDRNRVKGFLKTQGTSVINEDGEEIILTGWGLGNWLLCEGYMWKAYGGQRFDRPRRIEEVIKELAGSQYAEFFWKKFRENYVTKADIKAMADLGYNSVRIPMNWRVFLEDEPGLQWKEDGFDLLTRCLDWCEEYHIYAFLDLHGAPGGQTGANIDDCVDNIPRLYLDEDSWSKGIALWKELAVRYGDRYIVGGYDLLNEPIRPQVGGPEGNYDYLVPKLAEFYEEAIAEIRKVDQKHLISLEGHHWATNPSVFNKKYDDNMVIHFHRYGCIPDISCYREWLALSKKWDVPLWLGETGENLNEWYTAMYPLAVDLNFGYNLWPWKKMDCTNSPYSIQLPQGWEKLIGFTKGEKRPSYDEVKEILNSYLENMKIENCKSNPKVTQAVFRLPGCKVRATDFDEFPGKGISFSGIRTEENFYGYRSNTGMEIKLKKGNFNRRFAFDCMWDRFVLELKDNEFTSYSIYDCKCSILKLDYFCNQSSTIRIDQDGTEIAYIPVTASEEMQTSPEIKLKDSSKSVIKISVDGLVDLDALIFE